MFTTCNIFWHTPNIYFVRTLILWKRPSRNVKRKYWKVTDRYSAAQIYETRIFCRCRFLHIWVNKWIIWEKLHINICCCICGKSYPVKVTLYIYYFLNWSFYQNVICGLFAGVLQLNRSVISDFCYLVKLKMNILLYYAHRSTS